MPRPFTSLAFTALLAICINAIQPLQATAAADDAPVQVLQIGGSAVLLATAEDLSGPDNPAWRDAQEEHGES